MQRTLSLPLSINTIASLKVGDSLLLSGELFTARDEAHRRMLEYLDAGRDLPIDLRTSCIFYCGPSPTPPGKICGGIGPTTSSRMDFATSRLIENGLRFMLGKGERSPEVCTAIHEYGALYLSCTGGIAALLSRCVVSCETFAWEDLDAEAIYRIVVIDFPVVVSCF